MVDKFNIIFRTQISKKFIVLALSLLVLAVTGLGLFRRYDGGGGRAQKIGPDIDLSKPVQGEVVEMRGDILDIRIMSKGNEAEEYRVKIDEDTKLDVSNVYFPDDSRISEQLKKFKVTPTSVKAGQTVEVKFDAKVGLNENNHLVADYIILPPIPNSVHGVITNINGDVLTVAKYRSWRGRQSEEYELMSPEEKFTIEVLPETLIAGYLYVESGLNNYEEPDVQSGLQEFDFEDLQTGVPVTVVTNMDVSVRNEMIPAVSIEPLIASSSAVGT